MIYHILPIIYYMYACVYIYTHKFGVLYMGFRAPLKGYGGDIRPDLEFIS